MSRKHFRVWRVGLGVGVMGTSEIIAVVFSSISVLGVVGKTFVDARKSKAELGHVVADTRRVEAEVEDRVVSRYVALLGSQEKQMEAMRGELEAVKMELKAALADRIEDRRDWQQDILTLTQDLARTKRELEQTKLERERDMMSLEDARGEIRVLRAEIQRLRALAN